MTFETLALGTKRIAMLLCLAAAPAVQAAYDYTTVQYQGAPTRFFGVNNKGDAVGSADTPNAPSSIVFDLQRKSFTLIAPPPGQTIVASGINESGSIVGTSFSPSTPDDTQGFVLRNGSFQLLAMPGFSVTQARAVSNNSIVTGLAAGDGMPVVGFIFDLSSATFTQVPIANAIQVIAQGVNNRGDVVGSVIFDVGGAYPGSAPGAYGFVLRRGASLMLFRVNGLPTRARGITDSGLITGFVGRTSIASAFVAALPSAAPFQNVVIAAVDLIQVPGAANTLAQGIDNKGRVVGISTSTAGVESGFVAVPR